jgi:hypothetical protein
MNNIKFFTQLLSGNDIFISYRWSYKPYALKLAEELEKRGLVCFIDESSLHRGESIPGTITRAIRRSRMLVLIATNDITKSTWIPQELELARTYRRKIVPLNVDNTLDEISLDAPPWDALRDLSRIEESSAALGESTPADDVAQKIDQSYKFTRKKVKTIGGLFAAGLVFFAMSVVAAGSAVWAVKVRNKAQTETNEANAAKIIATAARDKALTELTTVSDEKRTAELGRDQAQREASNQTAIAAQQRQETAKQTAIATAKRKSAFALYLNQQAQLAYEQDPELGVRLDLEALEQAPNDDNVSRKLISASLRNLTKEARVGTVGVRDVEDVFPVPGTSFVVVFLHNSPSELRVLPSGDLVEKLREQAVAIQDARGFYTYEKGGYRGPWESFGFSFFRIRYASGRSEARDLKSGAVVFSGAIDSVGSHSVGDEYFLVKYQAASGSTYELRRSSSPRVPPVPLSGGNVIGLAYVASSPVFAVRYKDRAQCLTELRRTDDGSFVECFDRELGGPWLTLSSDHRVFALHFDQYGPGPDTVEVRFANNAKVPLSGTVTFVRFSPDSLSYVVSYDGKPGEIRRTDAPKPVAVLPGSVIDATFVKGCHGVFITYSDGKSEVLAESDGHRLETLGDNASGARTDYNDKHLILGYNDDDVREVRSAADPTKSIAHWSGGGPDYSDGLCTHFAVGTLRDVHLFNAQAGKEVPLPDIATSIKFVPDLPFAVIRYGDNRPSEFRYLCTGQFESLTVKTEDVPLQQSNSMFTVERDSDFFVISGKDGTELRRKSTGRFVVKLEPLALPPHFSPSHKRFIVKYDRPILTPEPSELRNADTGVPVGEPFMTTESPVFNHTGTVFSIARQGPNYLYDKTDIQVDVLCSDTGQTIVKGARAVDFSPEGSLFLVRRADNHTELWSADAKPHLLTELKPSCKSVAFDATGDRLITSFADGTSYLINATWLKSTWSVSGPLDDANFIGAACRLTSMGKLDKERFLDLLLGQSPLACSGK